MYVNSLLNGIIDLPPIPEIYKRKSEDLLLKIGINNFVKLIMNFDPIALEKISLNDKSRIKRIWEVYMSTGISYSEFINQENKNYINDLLYSPRCQYSPVTADGLYRCESYLLNSRSRVNTL